MQAINRTRQTVLMNQGSIAQTPLARLRGLLGHPPLRPGEGLLLKGEQAVHTVGMGYPIDVLFLDRQGKILHLIPSMRPLRFSPFILRAAAVLELPAGTAIQTNTEIGDQIELI